MKSTKYSLNLIVQNRETGNTDAVIKTREQYDYWMQYILSLNDIKMALKVFSEELGITEEQIKNEWTLVEIVNIMSTRYKIINLTEEKKWKFGN